MSAPETRRREPAFNAPWQSLALPVLLAVAFVVQSRVGRGVWDGLALSSWAIGQGRWETLVTSLFLHAGWAHLAMNAASAIAFGPPVARLLGPGMRGAALFFLFFLICGSGAGLGYIAIHIDGGGAVIGASGAISGLWGAASRLLGGGDRLRPILDRQVLTQAAVFAGLNVMIGVAGGFSQMNIAWEAHLAGYVAGVLLISPFSRLAGRSRSRELPLD